MKKFLLTTLLMVFVCGCAPTFEQKRALGWLSKAEGRRYTVEEHPDWENKIKEEVLHGNIVKGMTVEQVEAATGKYCSSLAKNHPFLVDGTRIYANGRIVILLDANSSGHSTYRMSSYAASVDGQPTGLGTYYLYFYRGRLESWSWTDWSPY